ncbi:MAG: hypothetical protein ACP5D7_23635 [Limnospira sp.]
MPEKAWLLLTKDYLYLMSSDEENRYYQRLPVGQTDIGEPKVEGIPANWFVKDRALIVNFDKEPKPQPVVNS